MKFTEARLEQAIIELLGKQGYPHVLGETISGNRARSSSRKTCKISWPANMPTTTLPPMRLMPSSAN